MQLTIILAWLVDNIGIRILTSLGIGFLSFSAVTVAADALISSFSTQWDTMTPIVLNLVSLAGFPQAIGWIIGGIIARLSLSSLTKLGKLPT